MRSTLITLLTRHIHILSGMWSGPAALSHSLEIRYLEETAYQLAKDGLILQATVLDAIGSDAVEKLADFVQDRIREVAATKGLVTSQRFSPGYCDWNIGQQRMLFWALNGNTLGIHLTGECLMIPQKSISGIIGIGFSNGDVESYNPCKTCEKHDCPNRR